MIKFMHRDGEFTCGSKWVCFKPRNPENSLQDYIYLYQRPDDMSEKDWAPLADFLTEQLNEYKKQKVK